MNLNDFKCDVEFTAKSNAYNLLMIAIVKMTNAQSTKLSETNQFSLQ